MQNAASYSPTLGVVASHKRPIRPGHEYDRFFRKPTGRVELLKANASVFDTLDAMKVKVEKTKVQTEAITKHFLSLSKSNEDFLNRVWDFLYWHIQYVEDATGKEQLRSPNRLWADRKGDCDCYALTISTMLTNAGIKHSIRIVKIDNKPNYQHVYVVVPKNQTQPETTNLARDKYWVVDPVLNRFNQQPGE